MGYAYRNTTELRLKCQSCKKTYDLIKLTRIVERENEREIKCPYCGNKIGELN